MIAAAAPVQSHDLLIVGVLSLLGVLATAVVTWTKLSSNKTAAHEIAEAVKDTVMGYLDTGNGHTAGQALARLEEQVAEQTNRLDRVEVIAAETQHSLAKHIDDVAAQAHDYYTNVKPVVDKLRADQADPEHVT